MSTGHTNETDRGSLLYSLEDWRTGKMSVHAVPERVYKHTLKDIIRILFVEHDASILNFHELLLFLTFAEQKWRLIRLPISRSKLPHAYVLAFIMDVLLIHPDAVSGKGCPDFLVVTDQDKREFKFIEIKASENSLSQAQVEWANQFGYDFLIAKPGSRYEFESYESAVKRIIAENKLVRAARKTKKSSFIKKTLRKMQGRNAISPEVKYWRGLVKDRMDDANKIHSVSLPRFKRSRFERLIASFLPAVRRRPTLWED